MPRKPRAEVETGPEVMALTMIQMALDLDEWPSREARRKVLIAIRSIAQAQAEIQRRRRDAQRKRREEADKVKAPQQEPRDI